jgi:FkbM family methyltransferase
MLLKDHAVRMVEPLTRRGIRHLGLTVRADPELVPPYTRAEIFWGIYERAEAVFIRRYLRGRSHVIELGAGLGITSAHIAAGLAPGGTFICAEANPEFLPSVRRNLDAPSARAGATVTVLHRAVGPSTGAATLLVDANPFASRVTVSAPPSNTKAVSVSTCSLSSIIGPMDQAPIDLVCDIEGAEANFILADDQSGLERCSRLVIELHDAWLDGIAYTVEDLLCALTKRWGFTVLERKGPIVALARDAGTAC